MTTVILNVFVMLAVLGFAVLASLRNASMGPEGPVGLHIAVIPPVLLIAITLSACVVRGRFDWVPGGKVASFGLILGLLVGLTTAAFLLFDSGLSAWELVVLASPFLVAAATFWAVNGFVDLWLPGHAARNASAAVLGLTSLVGWALMGYGLVSHVKGEIDKAERDAQHEVEMQQEHAAYDLAQFRALPADAKLDQLLDYVNSWNPEVQKEARERVASRPNLEEELGEWLSIGTGESVAWYIGNLLPSPSAKLAPAYAKFLERKLEEWRSTLAHDSNAGKWEPNISVYFPAAEKIQMAGGDLRPQLQEWHELLQYVPGMTGLAMEVDSIIKLPVSVAGDRRR